MKKIKAKKQYFPRVVPVIDTSSRVFVDKKRKSMSRRSLNDPRRWE